MKYKLQWDENELEGINCKNMNRCSSDDGSRGLDNLLQHTWPYAKKWGSVFSRGFTYLQISILVIGFFPFRVLILRRFMFTNCTKKIIDSIICLINW